MTDQQQQQHPITPPLELLQQWATEYWGPGVELGEGEKYIATQAARWGADQELEACCDWIYKLMDRGLEWSMDLRSARRPKPPSLKEQGLALIDKIQGNKEMWQTEELNVIRHALELLQD